ncbi:MAG: 5-oxoprolinase subunit PxpA [Campylobacteraceae bacterium]|nr:5-oxoprolinase subunit PxpA [Campylobacteraceae bacterium]
MIKLNCDMGEGFGAWKMGLDTEIMPLVDMSNIACGFHASDPVTMDKTVKLAFKNDVIIGSHPGYPDLVGFGRRNLKCSSDEIEKMIIYQIGALEAICRTNKAKIQYVKPHGALYNTMMSESEVFKAIAKAISKYDKKLNLMILSSSKNKQYSKIAEDLGIKLLFEVFADRSYMDDGSLMPRSMPNAVLGSSDEVIERLDYLVKKGVIKSHTGKKLELKVDCICVHGDNAQALSIIKAMRKYLDNI